MLRLTKLLFLGAFGISVSSVSASSPESESSTALYAGLGLLDLEKLEYDRPDDPALKLELARQYWCLGDRGLAVEHWRWLDQSPGPESQKALSLLALVRKESTKLTNDLCAAYPQKTL